MERQITPLGTAIMAVGRTDDPAEVMSAAEGVSVVLAHMLPDNRDPRAIRIPIHIAGGGRADLEALGFEWLEEEPPAASVTDYVTVLIPADWTIQVESIYATYLLDERGLQRILLYNSHTWWDPFAKTDLIDVGVLAAAQLSTDASATLATVRWHSLTSPEQDIVRTSLERRQGESTADSRRAAAWLAKLTSPIANH